MLTDVTIDTLALAPEAIGKLKKYGLPLFMKKNGIEKRDGVVLRIRSKEFSAQDLKLLSNKLGPKLQGLIINPHVKVLRGAFDELPAGLKRFCFDCALKGDELYSMGENIVTNLSKFTNPGVEHLELVFSCMTKADVSCIKKLKKLKYLNLQASLSPNAEWLEKNGQELSFGDLKNLEYLNLSDNDTPVEGNHIIYKLIPDLKRCKKLRVLKLDHNYFGGKFDYDLGESKTNKWFCDKIMTRLLDTVSCLKELEKITFGPCKLSKKHLNKLLELGFVKCKFVFDDEYANGSLYHHFVRKSWLTPQEHTLNKQDLLMRAKFMLDS